MGFEGPRWLSWQSCRHSVLWSIMRCRGEVECVLLQAMEFSDIMQALERVQISLKYISARAWELIEIWSRFQFRSISVIVRRLFTCKIEICFGFCFFLSLYTYILFICYWFQCKKKHQHFQLSSISRRKWLEPFFFSMNPNLSISKGTFSHSQTRLSFLM